MHGSSHLLELCLLRFVIGLNAFSKCDVICVRRLICYIDSLTLCMLSPSKKKKKNTLCMLSSQTVNYNLASF